MNKYGIIGNPLSHSFSKTYFTKKFKNESIDATYENYELIDISSISDLINDGISGFNVTIPYKQLIIPYLHSIEKTAKLIGAVNTVKIVGNKLHGFNTDIYGFERSIQPLLASNHQRALVLGTGGASKAVAYVLKQLGIDFLFVSRNPRSPDILSYNEVNKNVIDHHPFIINTTPVGMYPMVDDCPNIPMEYIGKNHFLYDLIYNPYKTQFLLKGEQHGALIKNGLDMLKLQAEKSWEIWNTES